MPGLASAEELGANEALCHLDSREDDVAILPKSLASSRNCLQVLMNFNHR